jgi:hypothetical protein
MIIATEQQAAMFREAHRRVRARQQAGWRPTAPQLPPARGLPGTELKAIFAALGFQEETGCGCKDLAAAMDRLGVAGCNHYRCAIVGRLRARQKTQGWGKILTAGALALTSGLAFRIDWSDPAPGLLDEAIRRAEAKLGPVANNATNG